MDINSYGSVRTFERMYFQESERPQTVFTLISPHFFDSLKRADLSDTEIEPIPGVKIVWSSEHRLPRVVIEDFAINEEAQLFYQMYGNQLVEGEI